MKLSVLMLARNEEKDIEEALKSVVGWADEIVVADSGSTDRTLKIAKKYGVRIYETSPGGNFCDWRNFVLSKAKGEWVFYLDADERATNELKKEIDERVGKEKYLFYEIPGRNFLWGKEMKHGGWAPDYVKRLFKKEAHSGWRGELHEEPVFNGEMGHLKEAMIHLQPETLEPMVEKSIKWSKIEARLLFEAGHPPVVWWRILRMGMTTFLSRYVRRLGILDGTKGFIMAAYQGYHSMIVYMQLWEMQQEGKDGEKKVRLQ